MQFKTVVVFLKFEDDVVMVETFGKYVSFPAVVPHVRDNGGNPRGNSSCLQPTTNGAVIMSWTEEIVAHPT